MSQITPDQLQALMVYASKQLGMTPEQLQKTVQTTDIGRLADDPQKLQQLLHSPQAQALLKSLGGK